MGNKHQNFICGYIPGAEILKQWFVAQIWFQVSYRLNRKGII